MSLIMPISTEQLHSKPMAISTIMSPVSSHHASGDDFHQNNISSSNICSSPSSQSTKSDITTPPAFLKSKSASSSSYSVPSYSTWSTTSSPNSSCTVRNFSNSISICQAQNNISQPCTVEQSCSGSYSYKKKLPTPYGINYKSISAEPALSNEPLSLQERRFRNKTASAKYRAKRNQQYSEMRTMISSLTKENELLLRQLENMQFENNHLRDTCDKLRGKIMAQKMLKQYLGDNKSQKNIEDNVGTQYLLYESTINPGYKNSQDDRKPEKGAVKYHNFSPSN